MTSNTPVVAKANKTMVKASTSKILVVVKPNKATAKVSTSKTLVVAKPDQEMALILPLVSTSKIIISKSKAMANQG